MMTGRGPLGKLVMLAFILFGVVMLGLAVLANSLESADREEVRAAVLAKITELGKETRDDRKLDSVEKENIDQMVSDIMKVIVFAQQKGVEGILILWAIGSGIIGVPLYFTRSQPI